MPDAAPQRTPLPQSERYEVQSVIGVGGMGKVYKAVDRKLKRPVALKFLRGADSALEKRFLQEAQAQARVDHPNVCKVYEVGRIGDDPYIAMQFIDGKTLRDMAPELTLRQKLSVMHDVALALQAAHQTGLIHRDLKPANVLVERSYDGLLHPFICDFGLARDRDSSGDSVQGALIGTPQYMAPEQARGESVDARSDVYGLGATLYEALAGKPPFDAGGHYSTLYKMLNEDPSPPAGAPRDVTSVVLKCLEKDPGRRYPTARALAEDLRRAFEGEPVLARPPNPFARFFRRVRRNKALSAALIALALLVPPALKLFGSRPNLLVAVADFDNQTGDASLDGLSGMLITSLEQSRKLSVLTRSRMFDLSRQLGHADARRRRTTASPAAGAEPQAELLIDEPLGREIARKASAQALLLGAIHRFDDLFVIDLKLIDPLTNEYVAALKEEGRGAQSVPRLIDRLSDEARAALKDQAAQTSVAAVSTGNLEAYQHYFRGEELIDRLQFSRAVEQFREAVRIDDGFALGWYRLAYSLMWVHDGVRGREAIDKALKLADKLPEKEKLLARGVHASLYSKGQEAYDTYKDCAARWPEEKECAFMLGDVIFHAGYVSYALPHFREALRLDPQMERAHQHLVWAEQLLGDKEALLAAAQDYVAKAGTDEAWCHLARAQEVRGELREARITLDKTAAMFPQSALPRADLAALHAWRFDTDAAVAALVPLLDDRRPARDRYYGHLTLGLSLVQGGRVREALRALQAAAGDAHDAGDEEMEVIALAGEGLTRFLYLRDAEGARKIAREAVARGLPETMFGFLYPLLGDIEKYSGVLHSVGDPLADKSVEVFTARVKGDYAKAAEGIEALSDKSPYRDYLYYVLADSWMQAQNYPAAIEKLLKAQGTFTATAAPGPGYGGLFRARSDYQLGILYERTGQAKLAAEHTKKFLDAWNKADADLPEPKDARARLARLQSAGGIELR